MSRSEFKNFASDVYRYSKKQNNLESDTISQDEIEIIKGREHFRQSHKKKMSQIGVRYDKQGFII